MHAARGFTLVEVVITVAILALAAAVVVPALSNVTRAELRKQASMLAGTMRATYDDAALSGEQHRLVFEFGKQVVKVEKGESKGSGASGLMGLASLLAGGGAPAEGEGDEEAPTEVPPPAELLALFGMNEGAEGDALADGVSKFQSIGHDLKLDEGVKILDVWIEGMDAPVHEGKAVLTFYPQGFTQAAVVNLSDEDGRVFAVTVAPLTGKTSIVDQYVEGGK